MPANPLGREDVAAVIEGRARNVRVPMTIHFWLDPSVFGDREQEVRKICDSHPMDVQMVSANQPWLYKGPADDPNYRWMNIDAPAETGSGARDSSSAIRDWSQLDGILAEWPNPHFPRMLAGAPAADGRYRLGKWWYCLFENHWSLRGMTNALMDFYTDPDSVHRLYRALTDFLKAAIERMGKEAGCNGFMISDDIGMQTGPFFNITIFREFFKPYYKELIDTAHRNGMHFWLHTCGNIELFLPEFIEIGLDVIHPIQKYTMDEREIARKFGGKIAFWAGMDVQQTIPWGTPEDVRREVRFMIDTYRRPEGRMLLTAGNGITPDCPVESLRAFFDETLRYGA